MIAATAELFWAIAPKPRTSRVGRPLIRLTGQVFGRLTVLGHAEGTRWRCRCQCGVEKIIEGADLRSRGTRSCGCLRDEVVGEGRKNIARHERILAARAEHTYITKIAAQEGISKQRVQQILATHGKRGRDGPMQRLEEQLETVREMRERGMTCDAIGTELGCHGATVRHFCSAHGLEMNKLARQSKYIGQKFHRLTILRVFHVGVILHVSCRCECGSIGDYNLSNVRRGLTKSCGCLLLEYRENRSRYVVGQGALRDDGCNGTQTSEPNK